MQRFTVTTADPDVAAGTVKEMFGNPIRFGADPGRDFDFQVDGVLLDAGLTIATMSFPTEAELDSGELTDYTVSVMDGDIRWRDHDAVRPVLAPFIVPPGNAIRLQWSTTRTLNIGFPADRLVPYTGGAVPSMSTLNADAADTRALEALVRLMNGMLVSAPDGLENPLIQASALEALIAVIGSTYPIGHLRAADAARPTALRRAVAYIDEHLDQPVTVAAVAAAARMSVRGLQALFHRELGTTPLQYLRRRRLAAARADLLAATDAGVVAIIARRWGFPHAARFAAEYRDEFGELPSATLRR